MDKSMWDNVQGLDKRGEGVENAPTNSNAGYDEPSGGSAPTPPPARETRAAAPAPTAAPRQNARAAAPAAYSNEDNNDEADPFADE